jgi:adenine-specific DNA methylase
MQDGLYYFCIKLINTNIMKNSSLEITEQEYLIKLNKEDFDLSFIHQLLKRIQSEQYFFSSKKNYDEPEFVGSPLCCSDYSIRFDSLRDK